MKETIEEAALWKEIVDSEQFLETISFENVEWVMQFDNDEPIVIARMGDTKGEEKEYVIRIGNNNNSNIHFSDGKGKSLKIFAREIKEKL
jgi:hypothetical protein